MTDQTLLDVIDDLTLPKNHRIEQEILEPLCDPETGVQMVDEDGNDRWHHRGTRKVPARTDALLQQLQDAITASMGGPSGKGKLAHERIPLDADALGRATRITGTITRWCIDRAVRPTKDPIADLRTWYASTRADTRFDEDQYLDTARGWVREVQGLLNPWDEGDLEDPCPRCGATRWHAPNDPDDSPGRPRPLAYKFRRTDEHMVANAWAHCRACDPDAQNSWGVRELKYDIELAAVAGPSVADPESHDSRCTCADVLRLGERLAPCPLHGWVVEPEPDDSGPDTPKV